MLNVFHYLLISMGINLLMFVPAYIYKTDKLTDLSYSLSFIALALFAFFINGLSAFNLILTLMIVLWAARLGGFLFIRIRNMKRDNRFDGIRESFPRFLRFWLLQGLAVWLILLPSLLFMIGETKKFFVIGGIVWAGGLLFETIADFQKYKFKQDKKNEGRFIQTGLWKYSRHPNYFGEILCWIGIYMLVFISLSFPEKMFGLISPVFITFILIFVTGIPLLEKKADKKWGNTKEYKEYKKRTGVLIPWPRR